VDIDRNEKGKTVGLKLEAMADPVKPKPDPVPVKAKKKAPAKRKAAAKPAKEAVAEAPPAPKRKPGSGGTRSAVPKVPLKT
jgi:hypothetical protein